jgi:hypothetical protein
MPLTERGLKPLGKIVELLGWEAPGLLYRPVKRFFKKSGAISMISTTGDFDLAPASTERLLVSQVHLILMDAAGAWASTDFGDQTALATGIQFKLLKANTAVEDFTEEFQIKSNQDLFRLTAPNFYAVSLDSGNRMVCATWDLVGGFAPVLLDSTLDILRFSVNNSVAPVLLNARADCFLLTGDE